MFLFCFPFDVFILALRSRARNIKDAQCFVLIFLQSVFGKMGLVLDNFLPFSWISASHWRFGYDRHRPDLIYIYTAFCMLLFLLAVISEWKIKRMDWVSKEEHR